MDDFKPILAKAATGAPLTALESQAAFDMLLSGEVTLAQGGAFLMALRVRGETVDEIAGAVRAMRSRMARVEATPDLLSRAVDIVGTGGDASGSLNVSTLAAIVTAACGVPVAKHGNRAASSRSGSADVLAALGVRLNLPPADVARCLAEAGLCFMFAPNHHASMRHVAPIRVELGTRTIFNILGPLANPAGVRRHLIGAFSPSWIEPMARTLADLGSETVWAVHGSDGLDEITTTAETDVVAIENGALRRFRISPDEVGLPRSRPEELKGGDAADNARALREVLDGKRSAYRDIAVLNAAAALVVAGHAATLADGASLAAAAIDDGRAGAKLDRLVEVSHAEAGG